MTARVGVHYPLESGRMVLRTDRDWERDLEPEAASPSRFEFALPAGDAPFPARLRALRAVPRSGR